MGAGNDCILLLNLHNTSQDVLPVILIHTDVTNQYIFINTNILLPCVGHKEQGCVISSNLS